MRRYAFNEKVLGISLFDETERDEVLSRVAGLLRKEELLHPTIGEGYASRNFQLLLRLQVKNETMH